MVTDVYNADNVSEIMNLLNWTNVLNSLHFTACYTFLQLGIWPTVPAWLSPSAWSHSATYSDMMDTTFC